MNMDSFVSIPINFPPIRPAEWESWWKVWNQNASFMKKNIKNQNDGQALWRGFDIYVANNCDSNYYGYNVKNINCPELFPILFDNLDKFPMHIHIVRAVSSMAKVFPHHDMTTKHISLRSLLFDNNPKLNFYYCYNNKKKYQSLPSDTNTWAYNDHLVKHGTDFYLGHYKILIMYWGTIKENILLDSTKHFRDSEHTIYYDN